MSDENERERFGRYLILDHLVDGGMAKICRARYLGEQADKIVAIKMVQPQFSQDDSFKTMFMDEIKVTFGLLHPNIVQTYDYGIHNGQLYVAMEYCDGRNLKEYLDKLKQKKFVFPVEISVYIITQACQGLHYAHTFTDKLTGKEANIIHRDISPHNIMLTYDGAIKVIDFGIAKAETNSEATQAGTIKGKLSYLAPEYLEGLELDHKYDQFAIGITLWEMLCSRKLFKAANDLAVLKKIQECKVPPPSSINPNVPKELDEIVMKSLHRDRNKRFENMDKLNRALIKFLYANYPDFNASDLSYFAKELFKEEIKKDREKLFEYGKIDIKPYIDDWKNEQEGGGGASGGSAVAAAGGDPGPQRKQEQVLDFGFEAEEKTLPSLKAARESGDSKTRSKVDIEKKFGPALEEPTLTVEAGPAKKVNPGTGPGTGDRTRKINAKGVDGTGVKKTKGKKKGMTKSGQTNTATGTGAIKIKKKDNKKAIAVVAALVLGVYFGQEHIMKFIEGKKTVQTEVSKPEKPVKKPVQTELGKATSKRPGFAKVTLNNFDKYQQRVYINGKSEEVDMFSAVNVPSDQDLIIRVEAIGRKTFVKKINLQEGMEESVLVPDQEMETYSQLTSNNDCPRGYIIFNIYGEERKVRVPFSQGYFDIPAKPTENGRAVASENGFAIYTMYFEPLTGPKIQREIQVEIPGEDTTVDICSYLNAN